MSGYNGRRVDFVDCLVQGSIWKLRPIPLQLLAENTQGSVYTFKRFVGAFTLAPALMQFLVQRAFLDHVRAGVVLSAHHARAQHRRCSACGGRLGVFK